MLQKLNIFLHVAEINSSSCVGNERSTSRVKNQNWFSRKWWLDLKKQNKTKSLVELCEHFFKYELSRAKVWLCDNVGKGTSATEAKNSFDMSSNLSSLQTGICSTSTSISSETAAITAVVLTLGLWPHSVWPRMKLATEGVCLVVVWYASRNFLYNSYAIYKKRYITTNIRRLLTTD